MHEVIRRPWARKLHAALFQLLRRRGVLVLVTLYGLVIDKVSDIQKHLARFHTLARNLFRQGKEHAMHLNRECAGLRLAFTLTAGTLTEAGQILLADRHV